MDGARFFTTDVARGKAALSAMFGQPSGNLGNLASSPAFANFGEAAQTPLYPFQGRAADHTGRWRPSAPWDAAGPRHSRTRTQSVRPWTGFSSSKELTS